MSGTEMSQGVSKPVEATVARWDADIVHDDAVGSKVGHETW